MGAGALPISSWMDRTDITDLIHELEVHQIEAYIEDHFGAEFSHGICPDCANKLYPELQ